MVKYNTSVPAHDYNHPYYCVHINIISMHQDTPIHKVVVPGHYQHKHCHYCSNNHYSIPSVTYVYLFILDVE